MCPGYTADNSESCIVKMKRVLRLCPAHVLLIVFALSTGLAGCKKPAVSKPVAKTPDLDSTKKKADSPADSEVPPTESDPQDPNTASEDSADAVVADISNESENGKSRPPAEALEGTWTTQKLIAYTRGGPRVIEFSVSLGGKSLEEVTQAVTEELSKELFDGGEEQPQWESLLEQPLVQSGWLGNLVADDDQTNQLITMYDEERDDIVTLEELGPFLSRGLARSQPLQTSDIGNAPNADPTTSPFGDMDQNGDYSLDAEEIAGIEQVVARYDYNGDAIISAQEIARDDTPSTDNNRMSMTMLETNTMLVFAPGDDAKEIEMNLRQYANRIHEHYTFLSGIPRSEWFNWKDERWKALDENGDELLDRNEVQKIFSIPPDVRIRVRFPELNETEKQAQCWVLSADDKLHDTWIASKQGAGIQLQGLNVKLDLDDAFSGGGPKQLRAQLENALREPQLKAFFTQQLQLQEDAFELIDQDEDEKLSDEEFSRVWKWLSARQGARLLNRWMTAQRPWFQLLDQDADNRLSAYEIQQAGATFQELDLDSDGIIAPNELPLVARFEVKRTDQRLENRFPIPQQNQNETEMPQDWFSAMDTNADGFISTEEFLGDSNDFSQLDADSDGFIGRSEVY